MNPVLSSTKFILEKAKDVRINQEAIFNLAKNWIKQKVSQPVGFDIFHFNDGTIKTVQYLFLVDNLNFCYWPDKGKRKWNFEGKRGAFGLALALKRAVEEKKPILDASYLSKISSQDLREILKGQGEIPLFNQRLEILRQNGKILQKKFDGQFVNCLKLAQKDVLKLIKFLAKNFPSFRDEIIWKGRKIYFYKRAQLLAADLHRTFNGQKWGAFKNMNELTCFADYRVPQILLHWKILEYSPSLLKIIKLKKEITVGSQQELEIRASTIWAVEYLKQALKNLGLDLPSFEIDGLLWLAAKDHFMLPHHRTRSIYY